MNARELFTKGNIVGRRKHDGAIGVSRWSRGAVTVAIIGTTLDMLAPELIGGDWEPMHVDNPEYDCTDAAHPAWWRGQEWGVGSLCQSINKILDGEGIAGVSREPWESTRKRIAELVKEKP